MSHYQFTTTWLIEGTCEEVYRTLEDVEALARWWPSVYLDVQVLEKGQPDGVGKVATLFTKGWLPYTLRWKFKVTNTDFPNGFALKALGDFVGKGVWTFREVEKGKCEVVYDWKIIVEKKLLKYLTPMLRPVFSANHHWAMRMGEKSLKLELLRLRAKTREELVNIPKPPPPLFPHNLMKNKI